MDLQAWVAKGMDKLRSFGLKQWGMVLLAGLCCLVIVFPTKAEGEKSEALEAGSQNEESRKAGTELAAEEEYTAKLEKRLSELLSGVENVGNVKVMITVGSTGTKSILQDGSRESEQITETDSAGGSRSSVSERKEGTTVFYDIEGGSTPYILQETYPEITGVVVLAQGSGSGTVDLDILDAVQVLFDVPAHKIKIMKMK